MGNFCTHVGPPLNTCSPIFTSSEEKKVHFTIRCINGYLTVLLFLTVKPVKLVIVT